MSDTIFTATVKRSAAGQKEKSLRKSHKRTKFSQDLIYIRRTKSDEWKLVLML